LNATARALPITRLVLHEPPYSTDDDESKESARDLATKVCATLAKDRRADAIKLFFGAYGLPPEMIEEMSSDPKMRSMAPTMAYDIEIMGEIGRGGAIPEDLVRAVFVPTLVIVGAASPDFFRDTAVRIAEMLPNGRHVVFEGDHEAPADQVAPVVAEFLAT